MKLLSSEIKLHVTKKKKKKKKKTSEFNNKAIAIENIQN